MENVISIKDKKAVANHLLGKGWIFVHLDPRAKDVMVPPWLKNQSQLTLQFGLGMPIPINDLRVTEEGIFGTLSFSRTPFACNVPWAAVFALVGDEDRGMIWPEDIPAEIKAEQEQELFGQKQNLSEGVTIKEKEKKPSKPKRGQHLRLVK